MAYYKVPYNNKDSEMILKSIAEKILLDSFKKIPDKPPMDLSFVLKHLKLKVAIFKPEKEIQNIISTYQKSTKTIFVSEEVEATLDFNYSIAFQIGLSITKYELENTFLLKDKLYDDKDIEAMIFSQYLLIPDTFLRFKNNYPSKKVLAKIFAVPEFLIENRFNNAIKIKDSKNIFDLGGN